MDVPRRADEFDVCSEVARAVFIVRFDIATLENDRVRGEQSQRGRAIAGLQRGSPALERSYDLGGVARCEASAQLH